MFTATSTAQLWQIACFYSGGRRRLNSQCALGTMLLLVDDDTIQLELRSLLLKMSGSTVLTAASPVEAIAMIVRDRNPRVDLAVLNYEMPVTNGCVLAAYLRTRYPQLKIILHSGAVDIPENQTRCVNSFIAKGEGVARLLQEISVLLRYKAEVARSATSLEAYREAAPGSF